MRDFISLTSKAMTALKEQVAQDKINLLQVALKLVLDQVDYTAGACRPNEMVCAVLPAEIIKKARQVLEETKEA